MQPLETHPERARREPYTRRMPMTGPQLGASMGPR